MLKVFDNSLLLRNYLTSDYDELIRLWTLCDMAGPERRDDEKVIERTLSQDGALGILIHPKMGIIGSTWITQDGRRTFVHHFAIHPDFRGQRLSHYLMTFTMKEINRIGHQVKLEVHHINQAARNLYAHYGFEELEGYMVYMKR